MAITKSATYFHPYELARIFASLDHITRGRVAWNIVTSLHGQGRRRTSATPTTSTTSSATSGPTSSCGPSWNCGRPWDPDALVVDKDSGVFADPDKIRRVDHDGKYFRTRGRSTCRAHRRAARS